MRIGETMESLHNVLAKNAHMATNKNKILILLYSSQTLNPRQQPHEIKSSSSESSRQKKQIFLPVYHSKAIHCIARKQHQHGF